MNRRFYLFSVPFLLLFLITGCSKASPNADIQKAIMAYLSARPGLDISKMDVSVTKVTVDGDHADADVTFAAKGAPAGQGMAMHYKLTRSGDTWTVQAPAGGHAGSDMAAPSGANPHGGGMPGGAPGGDKAGSSGAFHPDTSGGKVRQ